MSHIIIQHEPGFDAARFRVVRGRDYKMSDPVEVVSPRGYPVEGRPKSDLLGELHWYLEQFLAYPFPPETDHADHVQDAIRAWGREAFENLFGGGRGRDFLQEATRETGHAALNLQISSDDPRVLAWPWEALEDPETGTLAHLCQIERRINAVADPLPLPQELPDNCVNILLITARPFERDVDYRSISRPLVELVASEDLHAEVTLLRPPTFEQLEEELKRRPGYYHVVHFDGHGGYGNSEVVQPDQMAGTQGRLVFEDENGRPAERTASQLAVLLREHRIPAVVLNACQSAMIDERAEDVFASVAVSLLKAGIRSVVAMSYSLYVTAAKEFLPAFYRRLFEEGDFAVATRAGRRRLLEQPKRLCARGRHPLQDWLVPVHYKQDAFSLSFQKAGIDLPARIIAGSFIDEMTPYGFIGRDGQILSLERALHRRPPVLLIQGLGGVGKTTLAHGFVQWLADTKGIRPDQVFWFRFDQIHSAEYVINRLVERLFGTDSIPLQLEEKLDKISQAAKNPGLLLVWDDFEVVWGIPGTSLRPTLAAECREVLSRLVSCFKASPTKIVITSRGDEDWLERPLCFRLPLAGLTGEERWEFCEAILADIGLDVDRGDADLAKLIDELDGHPLAMRAVLPHLEYSSADDLCSRLKESPASFDDESQSKLFSTLRMAEELVPTELRPLLEPLSLQERFVVATSLETMCRYCGMQYTEVDIYRFLRALSGLGVLIDRKQGAFEIHGVFTRYLRTTHSAGTQWQHAFVATMGELAHPFAYRDVGPDDRSFQVLLASFQEAMRVTSDKPEIKRHQRTLMKTLGRYFENQEIPSEAKYWFLKLKSESEDDAESLSFACHHLGLVAQGERDLARAKRWFLQSLEISRSAGEMVNVATTCFALAQSANMQRDFEQSQEWSYRGKMAAMGVPDFEEEPLSVEHSTWKQFFSGFEGSSLAKQGALLRGMIEKDFSQLKAMYDEDGSFVQTPDPLTAGNLFSRGVAAIENKQFDAAESLFLQYIDVSDDASKARAYHELGLISRHRGDLDTAEDWFLKALDIKTKDSDHRATANTLMELGNLGLLRKQYDVAEGFLKRALELYQRINDSSGEATVFAALGNVAQLVGDFAVAEKWYMSALTNYDKLEDMHGFAHTRLRQASLYGVQERYADAAMCAAEGIAGCWMKNDKEHVEVGLHNLGALYGKAGQRDKKEIRRIWNSFQLGPFPFDS